MKKTVLAATLMAIFAATASSINLNGSWEFKFEEGKSARQCADAGFKSTDTIPVPGCYDAMPKWYLKRGTGLYRRSFTLEKAVDRAWLVIDGMGLAAEFMIDGKPIGSSSLAYSKLKFATGPLAAGEHTIFAALDNRLDFDTFKLGRPYYDFYLYGGFYHGVSLVFDDRELRVRTRSFATGTIEIEAVGFGSADFTADAVFDSKNTVKAEFRNSRATLTVPECRLWSPESPSLHTVCINGVKARFGVRTFEARGRHLYLNGKRIFLKGANRHEAHPTFGAATPESLMLADIQRLKELGGNFIRGAHYQQAQRFLDLCDENGILVWEESLGWGNGQAYTDTRQEELADRRFVAEQIEQTKLMVEASFNHPSVVIFAFMNEFNSASKAGKELADRLIAAIKGYDSGRLVSFACNLNGSDISNESTDIVSFNAYPGWIGSNPGSSDNLKRLFRQEFARIVGYHRRKWGDKPIIISENGTCGEYGRHDDAAAQWTEEFEAEYLSSSIEAAFANPDITGYAIWQLTDCRSFHRDGSNIRVKPFAENLAGVYDGYRRPKTAVVRAVKEAFAAAAAAMAGERPPEPEST